MKINQENQERRIQQSAANSFWIFFTAFLVTFFWFFIRVVFFDSSQVMKVLDIVRRINPIGYDLVQMLSYPSSWLLHGTSPYVGGNLYPPLATVLFAPLITIDIRTAYHLITTITLVCFLGIAFVFPLLLGRERKPTALLMLIFLVGWTSYGFQFELERGQFNIIAMALCFSAIYLFHKKPRLRWLAYVLFTISIQLKLFPAIFIFFFVEDWKDIRGNLKRFIGLGLANIALFFVLGLGVFTDFLSALQGKANDPGFWMGNVSIRNFAQSWLPEKSGSFFQLSIISSTSKDMIEGLLYIIVLGLIGLAVFRAMQKKTSGIDPYLLFVCTCAALLIPPVSHDFKIPLLAGPAVYLCMNLQLPPSKRSGMWFLMAGMIFLFALMYFSTQYSYVQKPPLLQNNFPEIFGMMCIATLLAFTQPGEKLPADSQTP